MAHDGYVAAASYLRAEEAEMLRELLASAGIDALVEDAALAAVHPFLQSAIGGAKVLVPADDAERAREIAGASGLFAGVGEGESEDIPEAEWNAPPPEDEATRDGEGNAGLRTLALVGLFVAALLAWLALSSSKRPQLPDPPWRTPPAQPRPDR